MEDERIVELYWRRDESAIRETQTRYGGYLYTVAERILADREDSLESVNDTYLAAWNSIPPQRPQVLATYLGRLARHIAIDRYRKRQAQKRVRSEYTVSLEELEECVGGTDEPQNAAERQALTGAIDRWLARQDGAVRQAFLLRYYAFEPLEAIASRQGCRVGTVKSRLSRARASLRRELEKEGFLP